VHDVQAMCVRSRTRALKRVAILKQSRVAHSRVCRCAIGQFFDAVERSTFDMEFALIFSLDSE
jgi:hypothetical protein